MPRPKRKDVLVAIRHAGYHGDQERGMLLYVRNWVGLEAFSREFAAGAAMRQQGIPCECDDCQKRAPGENELSAEIHRVVTITADPPLTRRESPLQ